MLEGTCPHALAMAGSTWSSTTLVPGDGEGTRVYYDGRLVAGVLNKRSMNITEGDGRIAIGRLYTGSNVRSGSHEVDELILFNKALTDDEIERLNSN